MSKMESFMNLSLLTTIYFSSHGSSMCFEIVLSIELERIFV